MHWAAAIAVPVGVALSVASAALDEHRLREHARVEVASELAIASTALPTRLDVQRGVALAATLVGAGDGATDPATWQRRVETLEVQDRSAATRAVLWVVPGESTDRATGAVPLAVPVGGRAGGAVGAQPAPAPDGGAVDATAGAVDATAGAVADVIRVASYGSSALFVGAGLDEVGEVLAGARDSGQARLSAPFWPAGSGRGAAEVALAVPVYGETSPAPAGVGERRAALTGWAVVTFRVDSFLGESLQNLNPGVAVSVSERALDLELAAFSTSGPVAGTGADPSEVSTVDVALLDRTWTLTGSSTRVAPWVSVPVLVAGLVITALCVLVLVVQADAERRAVATAEERTRDLRRRTRELETVTSSTPDALARVGSDGRLLFANPALRDAVGLPPDRVGLPVAELGVRHTLLDAVAALAARVGADPATPPPTTPATGTAAADGEPRTAAWTSSVDVGPLYYELTAVPEDPLDDGDGSVLVVAREMTRRRDAERRLGHAATHDPLTGLANRVLVRERAEWMLGTRGRGVAVLLLDLDRFKLVNDSYGHGLGDELLVLAAQRVQRLAPRGGTVGRLGGDEFVVVVPDVTPGRAEALARSVVEAFDEPFALHDEEFTVGCSLGVVHSGDRTHGWDELLRLADLAMYRAKAAGGGCFRWFEEGLGDAARQRLQLAADLRRAAGSDELAVAYQPEVDLRTGQAIAVEALMRWSTPSRGNVPPCEFIPVAEETGLIVGLGRWIMHDAVVAVAEHNRRTGSDVRMWVNVSARQLTGPDVAAGVVELLGGLDVPTRWLGIEVTESVLADDERVLPTLVALRDAGVGVAVDDFGTGYSSFARLRDYPVTLLKIDRAFVQGLADPSPEAAERAAHIVRAVIAVGRALGADVVAEGVEDTETLRHVRTLGCDLAQGYVFGRPGSLEGAVAADGRAGRGEPAGVR